MVEATSEFIEINQKKNQAVIRVNPKVYPIDLVYTAAYTIMDRAHVVLDGSPDKEILVTLNPRNFKGSLEELGQIFYDELIASAFYTVQLVRNKEIRDALITGLSGIAPSEAGAGQETEVEEENEEDIAMIWEERFGKAGEDDSS